MGKTWIWFVAGVSLPVIVLGIAGLTVLKIGAKGFSTREQPTLLEGIAARAAREVAFPKNARERRNPVPDTAEVLSEAEAHWADHCAGCHANNGSGDTETGKHLYPPAPDMRLTETQSLADGELFYIIGNGIRLSGMPSWGGGTKRDEEDTWKLVRLIRHLPHLTDEEISQMEKLNPKTPGELAQEREEEQFLNGEAPERHHH